MTHQSLYRKHRPQKFKEVAGQEHVTSVLERHIKSEKVPHAFLFAGGRGLGKTSIARILARELGTESSDLYEIDAASHNSVEDMRELTENVYTLPFNSKYKVYILDEVHMLSKSAWNAFLKTLEEPPAHVVFVLATTELEKVPETVRSRTEVFEFKKPSRKSLARHITAISALEDLSIDTAAADLIALLADGSYRDALSILEKVIGGTEGKTIGLHEVERVTGAPAHTIIVSLLSGIASENTPESLSALLDAEKNGVDMQLLSVMLLEYLRAVLLIRHAPELSSSLMEELGEDIYAELAGLETKAPGISHATLALLLTAHGKIKHSPVPVLPLELALYELAERHEKR